MTERLAHAIRRAHWAKDARQLEPKPARLVPQPPPSKPVELVTPVFKGHPMEIVQRMVATAYGIERAELLSPRRTRQFVRPRQVAMYLCSKLLPVSLPQIGRRFGDRDHTTVLHALRTVERRRQMDREFESELQELMDDLREILG